MKLSCEICGGQTLCKQDDGLYRCADCGVCYTAEQMREKLGAVPAEKFTQPAVSKTAEEPRKPKKRWKRPSRELVIVLAAIVLLVGIVVSIIISEKQSDIDFAKNMAEKEVAQSWSLVDSDLKLKDISFEDVQKSKASRRQVKKIIESKADIPHTDANGTHYESYREYWDYIGYDPYEDTWEIYEVTGRYHVIDGGVCDFRGDFLVYVIHQKVAGVWSIWKSEIEVPPELRP